MAYDTIFGMDWIENYQLFLFDLDGLLVNTEEIHYRAYCEMCKGRGFTLPWSFSEYFKIAQLDAKAPERHIYAAFPKLQQQEPNWQVLYAEKKSAYLRILHDEPAPLLQGVQELLLHLAKMQKKRCVVTHSAKELVTLLRKQNPILDTIPHWFTREDYSQPKPSPDGYLVAIAKLAAYDDAIIGFEDSLRGMNALMGTKAKPIFINSIDENTKKHFKDMGVATFSSMNELLVVKHLH